VIQFDKQKRVRGPPTVQLQCDSCCTCTEQR